MYVEGLAQSMAWDKRSYLWDNSCPWEAPRLVEETDMDPNIHSVLPKDLDGNVYTLWWAHRGEDTEENINSYH